MPACRYVEENGLVAILITKRSAAVAPDVNLEEHVTCPFWLWNPEEMSPEVENMGIKV